MVAVLSVDYSKCCLCMPYRAGVITIAVLTLLEGIGDVIYGSIVLESYQCYYSIYYPYNWNCYYNSNWYGGTSIGQGILSILLAIVLYIGVLKNVPNLLIPYITLMIMNALGYLVIGIVMLSAEIDQWMDGSEYYGIWFICWSSVICFFVSVVRTYRTMMLQQRNRGNLSNHHPHVIIPGNMAQSGPIATGQPLGIQFPPGTYLPHGYHQTPGPRQQYGTDQQQGIYLPPGTYLPHGTYSPPGSYQVPGPYQPIGSHQTPVSHPHFGTRVLLSSAITPAASIQRSPASYQQSSSDVPPHLNNTQQPGQQPQTGNSAQAGYLLSPAHNSGFRGDEPNLRAGGDDPPPNPGNDAAPLSEKK